MNARSYEPNEPVEIGDVVRIAGDAQSFATCIVTGIFAGQCTLTRPYAKIERLGPVTVWSSAETFRVPLEMFRQRFEVYVTGHSQGKETRLDEIAWS